MHIEEMTEKAAEFIAKWQYPTPYEDYSFTDCQAEIDDLLAGLHFAVYDEKNSLPCGFLAIGWAAQLYDVDEEISAIYGDESYTDIGFGLRPDLCGMGLGQELVTAAISYVNELFDDNRVRLTVASSNLRAVRLYNKMGFITIKKFPVSYKGRIQEMEIMVNQAD